MNKSELRQNMLAFRNSIPVKARIRRSPEILKLLVDSVDIVKASCVFCYNSFGSELCTDWLISFCRENGIRVALPRVVSKKAGMYFLLLDDTSELEISNYGISEIKNGVTAIPDENSVFIVPGVAFSEDKCRIGYGAGFYDAYFEKYPTGRRIGVCFEEQMAECLPMDSYDVKMHQIFTDGRML